MGYDLTQQDLHDLAEGAAVLGTGGGGDPYIGRLLVERELAAGRRVRVIGADELPEGALVLPSSMMGAPTVFVEKLPSGGGNAAAFRALEEHLGRTAYAVMPTECGGLNSMIPLMLGAQLGLPVVDADGMGRAFPELQMQTFGVLGVSGSPMAIASDHGDTCVIQAAGNKRMEQLARALTIQMGGASYISDYPMETAEVRRTSVHGTLSLCRDIGRTLRRARQEHADPFAALTAMLTGTIYSHGVVLFQGKVIDVERRTIDGFARGRAVLAALDAPDDLLEITFQNEHLVARRDGRVVAIVPDLICTLDTGTGAPVPTESLAYGQRLTVYGISTPAIMRTPGALACFGPAGFGLSDPYTPLEDLNLAATGSGRQASQDSGPPAPARWA
ncbi:DUF917 domain-containing protein [Nonomuraea sp. NBC_01738]|uniref:DUF917 domain-containing protein n=1 Tax=Nonomuraea sp. NBC_01738 TaxID=2976003 RepID=UPI002E137C1E|nr:DUF917 domain-containing protein [Nonomuraea sp. NBC_01738]